ncbi:MAG: hypothetical protein ACR2NX_16730 [Chthoniobacterales bacterium]
MASLGAGEGEMRLAGLMDEIVMVESAEIREVMLQLLGETAWRKHPKATRVRVVLVRLESTTLADWSAKKARHFEQLYSCELSRPSDLDSK